MVPRYRESTALETWPMDSEAARIRQALRREAARRRTWPRHGLGAVRSERRLRDRMQSRSKPTRAGEAEFRAARLARPIHTGGTDVLAAGGQQHRRRLHQQ